MLSFLAIPGCRAKGSGLLLQANQAMERGMLESNLEALRAENHSLQQRLDKALQELVRAATPSNPAVLRAFKVWFGYPSLLLVDSAQHPQPLKTGTVVSLRMYDIHQLLCLRRLCRSHMSQSSKICK